MEKTKAKHEEKEAPVSGKEYLLSVDSVIDEQKSSPDGLAPEEAAKRLSEHGPNKLAEGKKDSLIKKFFAELSDPMIIILIVAALISTVTELAEHGWKFDFFPSDAVIILFVVIVNAVLGVVQESKAEAAIEALQEMSAATSKVIRGGEL